MSEPTCCADVWPSGTNFPRPRKCVAKAKIFRDGKPYCLRHDPVAIKAKQDGRNLKYEEEWKAKQEAWEREKRLREFVAECANDTDDRISPAMKAKAREILGLPR